MPDIDSTARIGPDVELVDDVVIGPYCQIGIGSGEHHIRIGSGTVLHGNVIVQGRVEIGENNQIYHGTTIGLPPQDRSYKGEPTRVVIGNGNTIRENVTVHRGTTHGRNETRIGDGCTLMVGAHVAHDCLIGNNVLIINDVMLAGHVEVQDRTVIGGGSGVHQFCRIGKGAMVAGMTPVERDVLPYCLIGRHSKHEGLNYVGLKRSGVNGDEVRRVREAFEALYDPKSTLSQQAAVLRERYADQPQVMAILDFIGAGDSKRGITPGPDAPAQGIELASRFPENMSAQMIERIVGVLEHGRYIGGAEIKELEQQLAAYAGVRHCITCNSGTDALQIAIMALGIQPEEEVIVPTFTYFATAEAALLRGVVPVLVDIDPETYTIDVSRIEANITPRTRAIMPVSLFGQCADMDAIRELADRHRLAVIEDAAQSFGATHNGKSAFAQADIACTSFYPSKPLGGYGDGGACFTNDDTLAERMRMIVNHGQKPGEPYMHHIVGMNSRLDSLQAAVLGAKMDTFATDIEQRRAIAAFYDHRFLGVLKTPQIRDGNASVYAQYMVEVPNRDLVIRALRERGVDARIFYEHPAHRQPVMEEFGYKPSDFPVAEAASRSIMSIPLHPAMTREQQEYVASAVLEAVSIVRRVGEGKSARSMAGGNKDAG